jgi:26S proteasome regulatory subunit N3
VTQLTKKANSWNRGRRVTTANFYIMTDVEMKATDKKDEKKEEENKKVEPKLPPPTPTQEIKANIALIERAINDLEPRYTYRVLRSFTSLRKRINDKVIRDAIEENYPKGV